MAEQEQEDRYFLDISAAAYQEVLERLKAVDATKRVVEAEHPAGHCQALDMTNVLLRRETDERVKVWLVFDGRRLNPSKEKKAEFVVEPEALDPVPAA